LAQSGHPDTLNQCPLAEECRQQAAEAAKAAGRSRQAAY